MLALTFKDSTIAGHEEPIRESGKPNDTKIKYIIMINMTDTNNILLLLFKK